MLTLYHNDMSTCAQKVRFALAEKSLDWESRHLDLRALDQQKQDALAMNRKGIDYGVLNTADAPERALRDYLVRRSARHAAPTHG